MILKTDIFLRFSFLSTRQAVLSGTKKESISKTVPGGKIFAGLSFACAKTKTAVFEYDDVID